MLSAGSAMFFLIRKISLEIKHDRVLGGCVTRYQQPRMTPSQPAFATLSSGTLGMTLTSKNKHDSAVKAMVIARQNCFYKHCSSLYNLKRELDHSFASFNSIVRCYCWPYCFGAFYYAMRNKARI